MKTYGEATKMTNLSELQQFLYELTSFVHANAEKLDFLPDGIELDIVTFSGSLTHFIFTLENCLYAKGDRFIDTEKVFDWADSLGFKLKGKD